MSDVIGHTAEHTFKLDPHDQLDGIELTERFPGGKTFRTRYVTVKLADDRPWYVSASGPRVHPVTGLAADGSVGYIRIEWHAYSGVPSEIRAVIEGQVRVLAEVQAETGARR